MYTILPQTGDAAAMQGLSNALVGIGYFLLFLSCALLFRSYKQKVLSSM